jgi:hypothetical protein
MAFERIGAVESCTTNALDQALSARCGRKDAIGAQKGFGGAPAPEDDPPPENQTAAGAGRGGEGGNDAGKYKQAPSTPPRPHRQHLLEQAESYFHIDGAHHVDHPDRRPRGLADRASPGKPERRLSAGSPEGGHKHPDIDQAASPAVAARRPPPKGVWERDMGYPAVALLEDGRRIIRCRDDIQWILQKPRRGGHRWDDLGYFRDMEVLLSRIGQVKVIWLEPNAARHGGAE